MRAAVLRGVTDLAVVERPDPVPGPGEVLVRVASVGVCGSDVHYYEEGRIGDFVVREPLILGHEAAGVIVALGPHCRLREVGQRVALEPGVPCGRCVECRSGRYNLCPDMKFFATPPVDGAFCELVTLPEEFAHPVPDTLDDDEAGLLEPLSVALWASQRGRVEAGCRVLVTGAGPVGLLVTQVARARGAGRVVATDVRANRLTLARQLGADDIVDVSERGLERVEERFDVVVECSGSEGAVSGAIRLIAPAGRLVLVGTGADDVTLPMSVLQQREVEVTGTFRYANTYPLARQLAASGTVSLRPLVTGHFGLARTEAALRSARGDPTSIKVVVRPQE